MPNHRSAVHVFSVEEKAALANLTARDGAVVYIRVLSPDGCDTNDHEQTRRLPFVDKEFSFILFCRILGIAADRQVVLLCMPGSLVPAGLKHLPSVTCIPEASGAASSLCWVVSCDKCVCPRALALAIKFIKGRVDQSCFAHLQSYGERAPCWDCWWVSAPADTSGPAYLAAANQPRASANNADSTFLMQDLRGG